MTPRTTGWTARTTLAALAAVAAACGGRSGIEIPGTSSTVTATQSVATPTPTTASTSSVSGLVVLREDVAAGAGDPLGVPPEKWMQEPDAATFDRALGTADWAVEGLADKQGLTATDGQFAITGLAPGRYKLQLTKTLNGNLVPVTIEFVVGDDGHAEVVAEVGLGLVRVVSTYTEDGAQLQEVRGPYGNWLIVRDGEILQLGDPSRVLTDADGDGRFDAGTCDDQVWECPADRSCGPDRVCACTASCPFCDNCGPGVCVSKNTVNPYSCSAEGTCALPADQCVCVSSCPECKDCGRTVCVPSCAPVEIQSISVSGPAQLVVGRQAQVFATALLSDGTAIDVTYLATWQSSVPAVATVDSWGTV